MTGIKDAAAGHPTGAFMYASRSWQGRTATLPRQPVWCLDGTAAMAIGAMASAARNDALSDAGATAARG